MEYTYLSHLEYSYLRCCTMDPRSDHNESQVEEDRLSALPDDIVLNILEHLCLRMAVQTSTLSRRWRHLPRMLSRLDFTVNEFLPSSGYRTVDKVMASYSTATRKLLASTRVCAIKDLRLSFYLADPSYLRSIGEAVGIAVDSGNTEFLEFSIHPEIRSNECTREHLILFGRRLMSFLDDCPNAFRWLTSLTLCCLQFGDGDILIILNTCKKLQALFLYYCKLKQFSSVLKIDAPNSQLVALEFIVCYFSQVVLVSVPQLSRLVCDTKFGLNPPVQFGYVPRLQNISVSSTLMHWQTPFTMSGWLSNTTSLSNLYLDFHDEMVWLQPECPKKLSVLFSNLKSVHLYNIFPDCDLKWTLLFLEAAPSLNSLYVKISRHVCARYKLACAANAEKTNILCEASDFKHFNLILLDIKGFEMDEKLISYMKLVMERAWALRKIYLHGKERCESCDLLDKKTSCLTSPVNEEDNNNLLKKQLMRRLPSSSIEIITKGMRT